MPDLKECLFFEAFSLRYFALLSDRSVQRFIGAIPQLSAQLQREGCFNAI